MSFNEDTIFFTNQTKILTFCSKEMPVETLFLPMTKIAEIY